MGLPGAGRDAVIADDEYDIAMLLRLALEARGYRVHHAADGVEASDLVVRTVPALVVLDRMMPGMDGIEVLAALRRDPKTRAIPIVMLTAMASDRDIWEGWQAGADHYLAKPIDFEALDRVLRSIESADAKRALTA